MLWVHYAFYTCYSIYFLKLIIYSSVNDKRLGRNKNDMFWYFILKPQNSLKTLPFINETFHLKISTFMEHNMLSLANVFNLFLIPFRIVWFRTTHHMAPITNGILDIFLKDYTHWAEFLIPLAYRDIFYSLFGMLTVHMSSIWNTAAVTWPCEHTWLNWCSASHRRKKRHEIQDTLRWLRCGNSLLCQNLDRPWRKYPKYFLLVLWTRKLNFSSSFLIPRGLFNKNMRGSCFWATFTV